MLLSLPGRCVPNHMAMRMEVERNCDFNVTGVGSLQEPKCRDFLSNCAFYKRIEYCHHPDYQASLMQRCPKTCGYCTDPTVPPVPETPAPQTEEPTWKLEILNTPPGWSSFWLGNEPEPETTTTTTTQVRLYVEDSSIRNTCCPYNTLKLLNLRKGCLSFHVLYSLKLYFVLAKTSRPSNALT